MNHDDELLERALAAVPRNADGGFDVKAALDLLAELVEVDEESVRHKEAKRIFDRAKRPGASGADGQLSLPGLEPYAYEPRRLLTDDDGRAVELAKALPAYVGATARRTMKNAVAAMRHAQRRQAEDSMFNAWFVERVVGGLKPTDCTYDAWVRATGIHQDIAAPEEQDTDSF